jgi:hypothetical protein
VVPLAVQPMHVRMHQPLPIAVMELALQVAMVAKRMFPLRGMSQYAPCMFRQRAHRDVRRNTPAVSSLASHSAHRAPGDCRHHLQQVSRPRIAMKNAGNLPNALGEMRSGFGHRTGDLRKQPLRRRRNRLRHYWKQFAGSHSY